eukprot:jgi/Ulvmu1/7357/UM036_0017.1
MTRARTLPSRALSGLKIKVIDHNADYDAKGAIESQLETLGAQCGSSLKSCPHKALTHVVIVQRRRKTQDSIRSTIDWLNRVAPSAKIVDQLWVKSCVESSSLVQEQPFQIRLHNVPVISKKRPRRGRRTLPATCEALHLNLDAAFFSSTQTLVRDGETKSAKTVLGLGQPATACQANKAIQSKSQRPTLIHASICHSPSAAAARKVPAAARTTRHSKPTAQHSRRPHSMPDRRCSRELQSLGLTHNPHFLKGRSSPFPILEAAAHAPETTCGAKSDAMLTNGHLHSGSSSAMRYLSRGEARTRARAPALGFMLARSNMQLPIMKEDVTHGRRTDGLSALPWPPANVSHKRSIPVPIVRGVEWLTAPVPPRCRRCAALEEAAVLQGHEAALARALDSGCQTSAISPFQAIALGVWKDMRVWDWDCHHHRTPTVRQERSERGTDSSRAKISNRAEQQNLDSAMVSPASEAPGPEDGPHDFPALAAMGHGTRGRLSALVAVLVSGDSPPHGFETSLPSEGQEAISNGIQDGHACASLKRPRSAVRVVNNSAAEGRGIRQKILDNDTNQGHARSPGTPVAAYGPVTHTSTRGDLPRPQVRSAHAGRQARICRRASIAAVDSVQSEGVQHSDAMLRPGENVVETKARLMASGPSRLAPTKRLVGESRQRSVSPTPSLANALDDGIVPVSQLPQTGAAGSPHPHRRPQNYSAGCREGPYEFEGRRVSKRLRCMHTEQKLSNAACLLSAGLQTQKTEKVASENLVSKNQGSSPQVQTVVGVHWTRDSAAAEKNKRQRNMPTRNFKQISAAGRIQNLGNKLSRASKINANQAAATANPAEQKISGFHLQQVSSNLPVTDVMHIACSGVANDVLERCKRAVRDFGSARLLESEADLFGTTLTHLVFDGEKRSSKLLFAIACGATIVTPAWLVQCIRWRGWVPCQSFLCQSMWVEASARARSWISGERPPPLNNVRCHLITSAGTIQTDCPRLSFCKKVVQRLGGHVTSARRCEFCIVVSVTSSSQRPADHECIALQAVRGKGGKSRANFAEICAIRLRLPAETVIVYESWLIDTLLLGNKQPPERHMYNKAQRLQPAFQRV